jgi:hypothetical protein
MSRPYKIINGVSYPHLFTGKNQAKTVKANLSNPHDYYYDESVRLGEENVSDFTGKPICVEHDKEDKVGEISSAWKDADGKMRITARVFVDSERGEQLYNDINSGKMKGLSVGYAFGVEKNGTVTKKNCYEISLCREPFFPGAQVSVCATGEQKYKVPEKNTLLFEIMASETNSLAAPSAAPLDTSNKDASELARAHDELLRKREAEAAELKQLREQNQLYQKAETERLARYAESRKPALKEVLDLQEQQLKEHSGPNAELSADYRSSIESAFLNPAGEQVAAVVSASAMTWKKARDEKLAMETRVKELESKNSQLVNDQQVAIANVKASSDRISSLTTTTVDVAAAAKPLNMSNLFSVPSERERELLRENYGSVPPVSVNASSAAAPIQLPTHNQLNHVQNSMRFQPGGAGLFDFMVKKNDQFKNAPTYAVKVTTTRLDD